MTEIESVRNMDDHTWLTERFEESRPRLRGVAYRMLGSLSEAEDAVQEAWLRLNRVETNTIENLGGWLTTVVSRVCLDMLRSRKLRREEPIGAPATEPSRPTAISPMNQRACQKCGITITAMPAPCSFHTPLRLQAMT